MNILMITYNPTNRGTFLRAYYFARELRNLNHSVTILSTAPNRKNGIKEWEKDGVRIIEFPAFFPVLGQSGWDPLTISSRIKWIRKTQNKYDVVHGFESRPSVIYPALVLKRKGLPLILDWCDWFGKGGSVEERPNLILRTILRPFETFYENHFRTAADATTVICNTLYQRALDMGVDDDKLYLLINGFNMPGWNLQISQKEARKTFGLNEDHFVIGYVGSLFPKDAALMTAAFKHVHQQLPQARLLHLGESNYHTGEFESKENPILITGSVSEENLQAGLAACDVCWLPLSDIPANWGRFPIKLANYLSIGKPVISTDIGDAAIYIKSNKIGNVSEPNSLALSKLLINIANSPSLMNQYVKNVYSLSKNESYSWKERAIQLIEIYKSPKN